MVNAIHALCFCFTPVCLVEYTFISIYSIYHTPLSTFRIHPLRYDPPDIDVHYLGSVYASKHPRGDDVRIVS